MDKQEIFDVIVTHLLTQNKRSIVEGGAYCAYRGKDNLQCAVGCLISDEAYNRSLERESVSTMIVMSALEESGIHMDNDTTLLLAACQITHDRLEPEQWAWSLKDTADRHNLNFNPPNSL